MTEWIELASILIPSDWQHIRHVTHSLSHSSVHPFIHSCSKYLLCTFDGISENYRLFNLIESSHVPCDVGFITTSKLQMKKTEVKMVKATCPASGHMPNIAQPSMVEHRLQICVDSKFTILISASINKKIFKNDWGISRGTKLLYGGKLPRTSWQLSVGEDQGLKAPATGSYDFPDLRWMLCRYHSHKGCMHRLWPCKLLLPWADCMLYTRNFYKWPRSCHSS